MRVLGGAVLGFEAILIVLLIPVAAVVGTVNGPPWVFITAGVLLVLALIAAAAMVTRPWGVAFGWVLQGLILATSVLVPIMLVLGGIFVLLWWLAVRWGRRADALRDTGEPGPSAG